MVKLIIRADIRFLIWIRIRIRWKFAAPLELAARMDEAGNRTFLIIKVVIGKVPKTEVLPPVRLSFTTVVVQDVGKEPPSSLRRCAKR